ncbi:MAG: sensor histidine kinase [Bacteroidales bacterium]|nr:sensor histidine kinase [Bacteroidales bacterium]
MPIFHLHRAKTVLPILTWVGIFLMPLLITMLEGQPKPFEWYATNFFQTLSICIMYYLNYFVFVDRYLMRQRVKRFAFANVVSAVILSIIDYTLVGIWFLGDDRITKHGVIVQSSITFFIVLYVLFALAASLSVAIRMTEHTYNSDIKLANARKMQAETELANLKNQLNPHFLFNTLNNIYALIDIDTERSKDTVHDLSHLLRYVIYDTSPITVPLNGELAFIKEYVHIEQIRLAERCDITLRMPPVDDKLTIAPLLFLPFIENAFKHGINYSKPSFIHIDITLNGDTICCHIDNSDHSKYHEGGIGIINTTKRLNLLYPGRYTLQQGSDGKGGYQTDLSVKLT